jgi:hypothetical protein
MALSVFLAALGAAAPADAQTRLMVGAGGLVPFGDLENSTDPSARFVLRAEFQPVNARGVASAISWGVQVAYTDLSLKPAAAAAAAVADVPSPYLLEAGAGVRVYSRAAPFFLSGGAGYSRVRSGTGSDSQNGVDLHAGLGFLLPAGELLVEPEISGHVVVLEEGDFQYLSATLGVALPF